MPLSDFPSDRYHLYIAFNWSGQSELESLQIFNIELPRSRFNSKRIVSISIHKMSESTFPISTLYPAEECFIENRRENLYLNAGVVLRSINRHHPSHGVY